MMENKKNIFILCSGLGWGNASRQYAIIESLIAENPDQQIFVFTWGNGKRFFELATLPQQCTLIPLRDCTVQRPTYLQKMFWSVFSLHHFFANILTVNKYVRKYRPALAIFDSDYTYWAFIRSKTIRLTLNQAIDVIDDCKPLSWKFLFKEKYYVSFFIEWIDLQIQRYFSHIILAPSFTDCARKVSSSKNSLWKIPLIVRRSFTTVKQPEHTLPGLILSGSGLESETLLALAKSLDMVIFDPHNDSKTILDSRALENINPIVCQAGLSTISELLCLKKTIFVQPMPNHMEHFRNSQKVFSHKWGFLKDQIHDKELVPEYMDPKCFEGAQAAAHIIMGELQGL